MLLAGCSMAQAVRRHKVGGGEAAKGARGRERASQAAGRRVKELDISILREANMHLGHPQAPRGGGRL
jgi:hypothetical protein